MSLSKSKSFLTSVLLVTALVTTTSAWALDGMRLWAPYQPETFGGARRNNDGVYAAIGGIFWRIDGFGDDYGFRTATRLEMGNVKGHHGWTVNYKGILRGSKIEAIDHNVGDIPVKFVLGWPDVLENNDAPKTYIEEGLTWIQDEISRHFPHIESPPWIERDHYGYLDPDYYDDEGTGIQESGYYYRRDMTTRTNKTKYMDIDLMYNYRLHPLSWGTIDLFLGAQYVDLDNKYTIAKIDAYDYYYYIFKDRDLTGTSVSTVTTQNPPTLADATVVANMPDYWVIHPAYKETEEGELSNSNIDFGTRTDYWRVTNRIVGPKLGMKLQRRNQRWTFGADCYFTPGVNTQSRSLSYYEFGDNNPRLVNVRTNQTEFASVTELRLSARWQWTNAVGINVGFNSTRVTGIGRAIDLMGDPLGNSKSKHNIMMYGLNLGLDIRR